MFGQWFGQSFGQWWGYRQSSPYGETPAGRAKSRKKRKVFVERDGEILLFDSAQSAYDYLQAENLSNQVKSVNTGRKIKKPKKRKEFKPVEFDVIEVPKLKEFVDTQRIHADIDGLLRLYDFRRLIDLMEIMRDEEDIEVLLLS